MTDSELDDGLIQSGGGGAQNEDFVSKVARLIAERLKNESKDNPLSQAQPVTTAWSNFALSAPSTAVTKSDNTTPPLHYDQKKFQNDPNDSFDEKRLLKAIPSRFRSKAIQLLKQFNARGTELTWNSDGVIFIDQESIPESNIFTLFPYLYKLKHPKDLNGFDDFVEKIEEMGLSDLIVKKDHYLASIRKEKVSTPTVAKDDSTDWWYLG